MKEPQLGLISNVISTAILANVAFERAARHPSGSPGRRAAAAVTETLMNSSTTDRARRRLEALRDPALRADALALLAELEQLGTDTATEEAPEK